MKLYYCLTGYRRLTFPVSVSADVLNICMKYRYVYREMKTVGEAVSFVCTFHTAQRIISRGRELGIDISAEAPRGLPPLIMRYKNRPGLWLGAVFAAALVIISCRVVWDIRITGNETLTAAEIETVLSECGFSRGTLISEFNADRTEINAMLRCDRLAWISVNIKGTVAYVELREKLPIDDSPKPLQPANIIASHSGRVLEVIAYDGIPSVKAGDEVKAGDLLISGVYGERVHGIRVTRAAGYVKARTVRSFSVEIPYAHEEKVYSGRSNCEKYLIFFSIPVKVFVNSGNLGSTCDKIEEEKCFTLFGARLPVSLYSDSLYEYETVTACYTAKEASVIAEERLSVMVASELEGAKIISKNAVGISGNDSFILTCEIISVENIAKLQEFEVQLVN